MKNFMKKIAVALTLIMAFALCFAFIGCGEEEKTNQEEFAEYLGLSSQYGEIELKSGVKTHLYSLEKENGYQYRVWVGITNVANNNDKALYDWLKSSVSNKKTDLKEVGDKVVSFAKDKNWNNNYYLYVTFEYDLNVQTVYDYETDKIYIPTCDKYFIEMYDNFKSCNDYAIKDMQGGADWLVSKGLGEYKHGEFELFYSSKSPLVSMTIWCKDGKFRINDTNKSTAY